MRNLADIPHGQWIRFSRLPAGTTEEQLQAVLHDAGIEVPLEAISVKQPNPDTPHYTHASAMFSLSPATLVDLLNWLLNGRKLGNAELIARLPRNSERDYDGRITLTYFADLHPESVAENHG